MTRPTPWGDPTPQEYQAVNDRMYDILDLIEPTASPSVLTESTALICGAVLLMVVSRGLEPTDERCAPIVRRIAEQWREELSA